MMSQEDVDRIAQESRDGRGMWLGLFAEPEQLDGHPLRALWPDDGHVTLLHLGRDRSQKDVEAICEVLNTFDEWTPWDFKRSAMRPLVTGHGVLWRKHGRQPTPIALINSAPLSALRWHTQYQLHEHDVTIEDFFGFIPHVTLKAPVIDTRSLPEHVLSFRTMHLVCGDVKVDLL